MSTPENPLELLVLGAGPHSLSLLCRLLESSPFSILNDQEHQRLKHLYKKYNKTNNPLFCDCGDHLSRERTKKNIKVIDNLGLWMQNWNNSFSALEIEFLRSPLYFHPDPFDPESLRTFIAQQKEVNAMLDITHVMQTQGKKRGKYKILSRSSIRNFNVVDRHQFFTPSQRIFSAFCDTLVDRYGLDELLEKGPVKDVVPIKTDKETIFRVQYETDGALNAIYTKKVVMGMGSNIPNVPAWVPWNRNEHQVYHSMDLMNSNPMVDLKGQSILVVGGGLTSAQLVNKS